MFCYFNLLWWMDNISLFVYSCTIYIENASGIVVDVYLWCGVVHEFECYNISFFFLSSFYFFASTNKNKTPCSILFLFSKIC